MIMRYFLIVFSVFLFFPLILNANSGQKEFCRINKKYIDLSRETNKQLKLQLYKRKRKKELSKLNHDFSKWEGSIQSIDSVGDEHAYVSISVCSNVSIKTWNNEFSDMFDGTLIHIDSELYEQILEFENGLEVITSGKFLSSDTDFFKETSITDKGSLNEPEYLVNFKLIQKK